MLEEAARASLEMKLMCSRLLTRTVRPESDTPAPRSGTETGIWSRATGTSTVATSESSKLASSAVSKAGTSISTVAAGMVSVPAPVAVSSSLASWGVTRRISVAVIQISSPGLIRCGFSIPSFSIQTEGHTQGVPR